MDGYRNINDICSRHVNNMVVTSMTEWKKVLIPVQQQFPNCQKYKNCCKIDKPFWDELEAKTKEIEYINQPFRIKEVKLKITKPPKGFEDDIQRAKKVKFE